MSAVRLLALLFAGCTFSVGAQVPTGLRVHVEGVADARADLGVLRAGPDQAGARGIRARQPVRLRIEGAPDGPVSARLWVSADDVRAGVELRVDGRPVGSVPTLIDATHRLGVDVMHVVEVRVLGHADPGPLFSQLIWTAETD